MNYNYSYERPKDVVTIGSKRYLNFDIEDNADSGEDAESQKQFRYLTAESDIFHWDRKHLISAIIRVKYSADDVEAIVLNYGDGNAVHEKEYKELQAWRKHAKEVAADVIVTSP